MFPLRGVRNKQLITTLSPSRICTSLQDEFLQACIMLTDQQITLLFTLLYLLEQPVGIFLFVLFVNLDLTLLGAIAHSVARAD